MRGVQGRGASGHAQKAGCEGEYYKGPWWGIHMGDGKFRKR